jgi:hypothetical protein
MVTSWQFGPSLALHDRDLCISYAATCSSSGLKSGERHDGGVDVTEPLFHPRFRERLPNFIFWCCVLALVVTMVLSGALGILMLVFHVVEWAQSGGEWRARPLGSFFNADFMRIPQAIGWNNIVDAAFSYPAWLIGISTSCLALATIFHLAGWRFSIVLLTGYTWVPFFPFIIYDDAGDRNTWLGFRDASGNNRLHLAILSHDFRKVRWLSLSRYLREARNSEGLLPSDLANQIHDENLRSRVINLLIERVAAEQKVETMFEKSNV